MIKKVILSIFLILSLFFIDYAFANGSSSADIQAQIDKLNYKPGMSTPEQGQQFLDLNKQLDSAVASEKQAALDSENAKNKTDSEAKAKAHKEACGKSGKCLDQPTFTINISGNESILGGIGINKVEGDNTSQVINRTLGTIIQKLMVALGVLAVLIMTVGAGYIIMYHGQDELLSKGKSIFMAGVTSLVVALSSYYLVSILRFILYN